MTEEAWTRRMERLAALEGKSHEYALEYGRYLCRFLDRRKRVSRLELARSVDRVCVPWVDE